MGQNYICIIYSLLIPNLYKESYFTNITRDINNVVYFRIFSNNFLSNYFSERGATVIEEKVIRKNSEIDYVVDIPSNIGKVRFFVKVRNKKTVNDADIVLAHNEAQLRKLPLLFLSSGEVNKKGEEYLTKNFVVFEKI